MRASPEHRRGRTYLHGVLLAGTQPFRYRGAVARLLGAQPGVVLRSSARFLPGGAFAYLPVQFGGGPAPLAAQPPRAPASAFGSQRALGAAPSMDASGPAHALVAGRAQPERAAAHARAPERRTASEGVARRALESASLESPVANARAVSPAGAPAVRSTQAPAANPPATREAPSAPSEREAAATATAERRVHAVAREPARRAEPERAAPAPPRKPLVELARALEAYNFRAAPAAAPPTSSALRPVADARAARGEAPAESRGDGVAQQPPAPPCASHPAPQEIWIPDMEARPPARVAEPAARAPTPRQRAARPLPEPTPSAAPPPPAARARIAEGAHAVRAQPPCATQASAAGEANPGRPPAAPKPAARPPRARAVVQARAAGPSSAFWQRAHLTHLSLRLLK